MRILAAVALLASLVLPAPAQAGSRSGLVGALRVLHSWDARRAEAWAGSDVVALRSLYVGGSAAGRADVRLLRAYTARGCVVRRLVTQVFALDVLHGDRRTLRLRVFDRVAGGEVVCAGDAEALSSTPPVVRVVELRQTSGRWRVESVSGSG
jgi:hypothetical protein